MLIRDAEIFGGARADVCIEAGIVAAIAPTLIPGPNEVVIDARGAALLPGLHDHHLHLNALAASLDSVRCGPPQVIDKRTLGLRLRQKAEAIAAAGSSAWVRGIGYCESVAGDIDRDWLDKFAPHTPVRIQHRSGRLWILNSRALDLLASAQSFESDEHLEKFANPLEKKAGRWTGRLYDADAWLRQRLRGTPPDLRRAGALLSSFGVTGFTEVTPHNSVETARLFAQAQARADIAQDIRLMGDASLDDCGDTRRLRRGERKIHLHDSALPDLDELVALIATSHAAARCVAIHCVTLTELLFALGALARAGGRDGDRIEHAAVAPPEVLPLMRDQGVTVVTQPHFIAERGDRYLREVDISDRPWLYRGKAWLEAGIPLAAGTDAPFGGPDPWRAMQAAVTRTTRGGVVLDRAECLTPEQALALFLGDPADPGGPMRRIAVGGDADLCLLDRSWSRARTDFAAVRVIATVKNGVVIHRGGE